MYPTKKLSEIAKVINWRAYKADELLDSWNTRVLRVWNLFTNNHWYFSDLDLEDDKYCDNWDLIYAWSASFWPFIWNWWKCIYHYHIWKIVCSENIDKQYLYWYLFYQTKSLSSKWNWVWMIHITKGMIEDLDVLFPPLSTQSKIVAKLDEAFSNIDRQISLLKANIEDVEHMKFGVIEQIFEEWNFEIKTLKDVCERIMDGTHFSPKNSDTWDRLYVSAKNIKLHGVDLTKATYISQADHEIIYKRCPVKKWDVLYIKDGATTWVATINQLDEEFSLLSSVAVFQVKKSILSERFLNYYLNSSFGKKHMISMMWWAAITRLTLTKLNSGLIPLPPLPRQHEIVEHLDRVFAHTAELRSSYEAQIRDLETLRQSLLEEVFAGRLVSE